VSVQPVYRAVTKASVFKSRVDKLISDNKPFGYDIESGYVGKDRSNISTNVSHPDWRFVSFSYTNSEEWADSVPMYHDDETINVDDKLSVIKDLWRLLQTGLAVAHNAYFELLGTSRLFREHLWNDPEFGEAVRASYGLFPIKADTLLIAFNMDTWTGEYSCEPDENGRKTSTLKKVPVGKGLKELVWYVIGHKMIEFSELFEGMGLKTKSSARFNILSTTPQVIKYACEDALYCLKLLKYETKEIQSDKAAGIDFNSTALKIDKEVLYPTFHMEQVGINLDFTFLKAKLAEAENLRDEMNEEIQEEISELLGTEANVLLTSPKQVAELLYDKLGIEKPRERGEETRSTSEKSLTFISKNHKIIRDILTYRTVVKMIGSYLKKYITELDYYGDGRAWPQHNTTGAVTGRFSVSGMSYQQLPKPYYYKLKNGREFHLSFRDAIIAPEDYRIVGFDYSQIQLRLMAGMAKERTMIKAFSDGIDIHTATASSMLKIPVDKVTGKQRSTGKTLNFAIVFGQGADQLADDLSTPEEPVSIPQAEKLLQQYFTGYPELKGWMDTLIKRGELGNYIYGLFGRRYKIWEFQSSLRGVYNKGKRMAVNEPVQGGEAYYMKRAMIQADKAIREAGLQDKIKMCIMIHDALGFYVHKSISTQQVIDLLYDSVSYRDEEAMPGYPDISSDWHEGNSFGDVIEIDLDENRQITGYSMKAEVLSSTGLVTEKWKGETFNEVDEQYQLWKKTDHPEALNKRRMAGEVIPEKVVEEEIEEIPNDPKHYVIHILDKIKDPVKFKTLFTEPGNNTITIISGNTEKTLPGTYKLSISDKSRVTIAIGKNNMYEKHSELLLEEIPF